MGKLRGRKCVSWIWFGAASEKFGEFPKKGGNLQCESVASSKQQILLHNCVTVHSNPYPTMGKFSFPQSLKPHRYRTKANMSAKLAITDKLHMPKCAAQIPRLGFSAYKSTSSQCIASCTTALKVGYRHIDTAQYHDND